jgi:hypothetical protein
MELERVDQKMGENAEIQSTAQENILKNHETFDSDDGNSSDGSSVHSNGEVRPKIFIANFVLCSSKTFCSRPST